MWPLAGGIVYAEGLSAAIAVYTEAGGGTAGIQAARLFLHAQFGTASNQAIEAVIRYVRQTLIVGQQYASGGPGYAPAYNTLPDVRRIEAYAGIGPNGATVQTTGTVVTHELRVDIIDPETGDPWYTVPSSIESPGVLTRAELEARAAQEVMGMLRALDTVPAASGRDHIDFQVRVRFRGAWIGYQ
jgi:hypothetical protein